MTRTILTVAATICVVALLLAKWAIAQDQARQWQFQCFPSIDRLVDVLNEKRNYHEWQVVQSETKAPCIVFRR